MLCSKVKLTRILTYVLTNISGLIIYSIIYPSFYSHIFGTHRGTESTGNLLNLNDYVERLKKTVEMFNTNIFADLRKNINPYNHIFYSTCYYKKNSRRWIKR